jgi:hypothetical protein
MRNHDDEDRVSWDVGRTVEELLLLALLLPLRIIYTTALYFAIPINFSDSPDKQWRSLQVLCRPLTFATGNWIVYLFVIRLVWGELKREISNPFNMLINFLSPAIFSGNAMQVVLGIAPVLVLISMIACFQAAFSRIFGARLSFVSHIDLAAYGIGAFAAAGIVANLIVGQRIQSFGDIGENMYLFSASMLPFGIIIIRWTMLLSHLGLLTFWRSLATLIATWSIAIALVLVTAIIVTDLSQKRNDEIASSIQSVIRTAQYSPANKALHRNFATLRFAKSRELSR